MEIFGLNFWGLIFFFFLAVFISQIQKFIYGKTRIISFSLKSDVKTFLNDFRVLKNLKSLDEKVFIKLYFFVTYLPNINSIYINDERVTKMPYLSPLTYSSKIDDDFLEIKLGDSKNKNSEIKFKIMFRRQSFPKPHLMTGYFVEENETSLEKPTVEKIFDFPIKLLDSPMLFSKLLAKNYGFEYESDFRGPLNNVFDEQQYDSYSEYSFTNKYFEISYQDS